MPRSGSEHLADLGGLDVHVDELAAAPVGLQVTGVPVTEPGTDGQHQVLSRNAALPHRVCVLEAGHAGEQRVVLRERALAHQRDLHRHLEVLGQVAQLLPGLGADHAAAGQDERPLRVQQHLDRRAHRLEPGLGLGERQRRVHCRVVETQPALHVDRQVDEHRAGPAGAGDPERLAEHPGRLGRLLELHRPLGHRLGDLHDVDRLERLLVQLAAAPPGR